uniref:Uncharacterized protein n=1 Tax=Aegilops tauschii subsp. strangulata TaxID=200361 RepID=A0A453LKP7_AEGTS
GEAALSGGDRLSVHVCVYFLSCVSNTLSPTRRSSCTLYAVATCITWSVIVRCTVLFSPSE